MISRIRVGSPSFQKYFRKLIHPERITSSKAPRNTASNIYSPNRSCDYPSYGNRFNFMTGSLVKFLFQNFRSKIYEDLIHEITNSNDVCHSLVWSIKL